MAEHDAFEARFHRAVHSYAGRISSDLDPVGLARTIAAGEPRRTRPGAVLGQPAVRVPHLAWLLVILVLVALAAAAVASFGARREGDLPAVVPPPAMAECPPGSTPDQPGPVDQDRPPPGDVRMTVDRDAGRIVAFTPDAAGKGTAVWTFDVCTNTWTRQEPEGEPGPAFDFWLHPVFDADAGLAITFAQGGTPWAYDLGTRRWTAKARSPVSMPVRAVYDPVSGLVYVQPISSGDDPAPPQFLQTYDVETDTWDLLFASGTVPMGTSGDHLLFAYDSSVERIVAVQTHQDRTSTRQFDPRTGFWTGSVTRPIFNTGYVASGGEIAYDEAAKRTIVYSAGRAVAYDAAADGWETLAPGGSPDPDGTYRRMGHWMVYDPLNQRIVIAGGTYLSADGQARVRADDLLALDVATEEWTQLLAPSRVERYDGTTETWVDVRASPSPG